MGLFSRTATPTIDARTAAARHDAGEVTILDVREPAEWAAGHIPGAVHIPLGELGERAAELPTDRPIIAACRSGARSAKATQLLNARKVETTNLEGGTQAWHAAGLPLDPPDGHVA